MFEACLKALGSNTLILSKQETSDIFKVFKSVVPITEWGRIDWEKVGEKKTIKSTSEIMEVLHNHFKNFDTGVVILWDDGSLPAVQTDLENITRVIEDVTAVSFDTWIFCQTNKYVIEFYHEGETTIGFLSC